MAIPKIKPKNRTIYYFRASFLKIDGVSVSNPLEEMLLTAWKTLDTTHKRTFYIGEDRSLVGMKLATMKAKLSTGNKDCTVFSIGLFEEGSKANTITKPSISSLELEADTYDAPKNHEFLDAEAFVCIHGDHLFISPTANLRASAVSRFISSLLINGGYSDEGHAIDIQQVADLDAFKTINDEGVSNIVINAAVYLTTLQYIERVSQSQKMTTKLRKITNMVKTTLDNFRDDDTDTEILEKEGLNARIQISHDGRATGADADAGQDRAKNIAQLLATSDVGGYAIITKKGTKLTSEDTVLKQTVKVDRHGKSVNRDRMWEKLVESLEKFQKDGILEQ